MNFNNRLNPRQSCLTCQILGLFQLPDMEDLYKISIQILLTVFMYGFVFHLNLVCTWHV